MKYLPEPSSMVVKRQYGHDQSVYITPYSSLDWRDTAIKYGIQVPEIVDMTQGMSECRECKAKYVGYQERCGAKVIFHKVDGAWHDTRGYNGYWPNFEKTCDGALNWNLREKFSTQESFFNLLEKIRTLPDTKYQPLVQFKEYFPEGVTEALKLRFLMKDVEELNMKLPSIVGAIQQIAEKMNLAGGALRF